jgi:predicted ester cyclase
VVLNRKEPSSHPFIPRLGDFQGIAPTGRRILFGQIAIYRMVDGKIAEVWEEADLLGLLQQLGASSQP